MLSNDRFTRIILVWIAVAMTILAVDRVFQIRPAFAQDTSQSRVRLSNPQPTEVVIKGPVDIRIIEWRDVPDQPVKVKIDDPWPARIEIKDEIRVKGEIKTIN